MVIAMRLFAILERMVFNQEIKKDCRFGYKCRVERLSRKSLKGTARQLSSRLGKRLEKSGIGSSKDICSLASLKAMYSTSCKVMVFIIHRPTVSTLHRIV